MSFCLFVLFYFVTWSLCTPGWPWIYCAEGSDHELPIFLSLPPQCWDSHHVQCEHCWSASLVWALFPIHIRIKALDLDYIVKLEKSGFAFCYSSCLLYRLLSPGFGVFPSVLWFSCTELKMCGGAGDMAQWYALFQCTYMDQCAGEETGTSWFLTGQPAKMMSFCFCEKQ